MPHGSQKDGVERPQLLQTIGRHHLSGFRVGFAAPIELLPSELEPKAFSCRFEDADAFGNDFFPDAIAGDDGNTERFHFH
jgi:hypothetical protein